MTKLDLTVSAPDLCEQLVNVASVSGTEERR